MNFDKKHFIQQISETVAQNQLLDPNERVLIALSGGADSVALLCVLLDMGYTCVAVHCNFNLRGEESVRDENFVRALCRNNKVRIYVKSFDTIKYSNEHGISIEMAARELRYAYFEEILQLERIAKVAVAHHRDDNIETMLLNLVRGTGIKGLCGMAYCRDAVIRPLLDVSRDEILNYLMAIGQDYVTDSSNLENDVKRNKIRLDIMPLFKMLNPSVMATLQEEIQHFTEAYHMYDWSISYFKKLVCHNNIIDLDAVNNTPSPQALLYEILSQYGFNSSQISDIIKAQEGISGKIYESENWRLLRDRQTLQLRSKSEAIECLCTILPLEGTVQITKDLSFVVSRQRYDSNFVIPHDKKTVCFDLNKLQFPLTVRLVEKGDRFVPFGMKGSKLVSDYLTDIKKTIFEKEQQLVVCCGHNIAWLVGERPDERFRVDQDTERILIIRLDTHTIHHKMYVNELS